MKKDVRGTIYKGMKGLLREEGLLEPIPKGKIIHSKNDPRIDRKRSRAKKWHIDTDDDM